MGYAAGMSQTLERRVEDLERNYFALSEQVLDLRRRKKDWRGTIGTLDDDAMTREAERLGREYREQQTYDKELVGP
jgi:hypothetical protein